MGGPIRANWDSVACERSARNRLVWIALQNHGTRNRICSFSTRSLSYNVHFRLTVNHPARIAGMTAKKNM